MVNVKAIFSIKLDASKGEAQISAAQQFFNHLDADGQREIIDSLESAFNVNARLNSFDDVVSNNLCGLLVYKFEKRINEKLASGAIKLSA